MERAHSRFYSAAPPTRRSVKRAPRLFRARRFSNHPDPNQAVDEPVNQLPQPNRVRLEHDPPEDRQQSNDRPPDGLGRYATADLGKTRPTSGSAGRQKSLSLQSDTGLFGIPLRLTDRSSPDAIANALAKGRPRHAPVPASPTINNRARTTIVPSSQSEMADTLRQPPASPNHRLPSGAADTVPRNSFLSSWWSGCLGERPCG